MHTCIRSWDFAGPPYGRSHVHRAPYDKALTMNLLVWNVPRRRTVELRTGGGMTDDMGRRPARQRVNLDRRTIDAFTDYAARPNGPAFRRILSTPGAKLAYSHHKWSAFTSSTTIDEFWKDEFAEIKWGRKLVSSVEENIAYLGTRRNAWIRAVLEYLPRGHVMDSEAYLIGGYDSVVWGEDVALNLADARIVDDRREAVYYLIHELAHAGYFRYHRMPDLASLGSLRSLVDAVKLLTHLEGMGVLSPFKLRMKEGGLSDDDYRVLIDEDSTRARVREYFEALRRLEVKPDRALRPADYSILGRFSSRPKRLWYVAGCYIAMKIEERLGAGALRDMVRSGPGAFFQAYYEIEDPLSL